MLPIFSPDQIKKIEQESCSQQGIQMIDLMERAGKSFASWFLEEFPNSKTHNLHIFCGNGNNGGDGLVVARILSEKFDRIYVYIAPLSSTPSPDYQTNLERLFPIKSIITTTLHPGKFDDKNITPSDIIIDALLGTGCSKPFGGDWLPLIRCINSLPNLTISIDMPSGVQTFGITNWECIQSDIVVGFEYPKLAYLLPENQSFIKKWIIRSIGLSESARDETNTNYYFLQKSDIQKILKPREKFSHKNNFGHCAVVAGSNGMCGASVLATRSCLRTGCGLVTCYTCPECINIHYEKTSEVMINNQDQFLNDSLSSYHAVLIGPGMKNCGETDTFMRYAFQKNIPLILDAEAIRVLGNKQEILNHLPADTILTPHIGEFENLTAAQYQNSIERINSASRFASQYNCYLILKGAFTSIHTPNGKIYFNSTGNQGMATAGSGDVLGGILGSLRAQGYNALQACLMGVYIHGLAGDLALGDQSYESMMATDITENLGKAFKSLY